MEYHHSTRFEASLKMLIAFTLIASVFAGQVLEQSHQNDVKLSMTDRQFGEVAIPVIVAAFEAAEEAAVIGEEGTELAADVVKTGEDLMDALEHKGIPNIRADLQRFCEALSDALDNWHLFTRVLGGGQFSDFTSSFNTIVRLIGDIEDYIEIGDEGFFQAVRDAWERLKLEERLIARFLHGLRITRAANY